MTTRYHMIDKEKGSHHMYYLYDDTGIVTKFYVCNSL